jgi:hypothetical protein
MLKIYIPMSEEIAGSNIELVAVEGVLFANQRDWWDDETFLGLARVCGMECPSRYASLTSNKVTLTW